MRKFLGLGLFACLLNLTAAAGAPQADEMWNRVQVSGDCIAYVFNDPYDTRPKSYSWSGACNADKQASGSGSLSITSQNDDSMSIKKITGVMVNGRFNGNASIGAYSDSGHPGTFSIYDNGTDNPYDTKYSYGCEVADDGSVAGGCIPTNSVNLAAGTSSQAPAAAAAQQAPDIKVESVQQVGNGCVTITSGGTRFFDPNKPSDIVTTLKLHNGCGSAQVVEALAGLGNTGLSRGAWGGYLPLQPHPWEGNPPESVRGLGERFMSFVMPADATATADVYQMLGAGDPGQTIRTATAACDFEDGKGHYRTMFRDAPLSGFNKVVCLTIGVDQPSK